ncbi:MAG: tetratricopeptide repeat protein [Ktedonobacteraceae bacterium]
MTQTTLREYLRTTEDAISSGRINEAMVNCQNILSYFPEALEAQHLLGEVYLAQGQLEEAQQTFEWILTNDPENVIVYCDRALISERASDIDTALDCYQQAYELSRGNANIRQEFNQLSARAGQQEFMLSRAGLARLYMRGGLLTQAIQEWEAVLASSPERLDARLGLIETYWHEGLFDKAEHFATQLLEEIPTCLKALLYLAHITSISNVARAKDLLQRAETLDPELHMAQEIFADLAAKQPNDPFLTLIQKEPILLENGVPVNRPVAHIPVEQPAPIQNAAPAPAYNMQSQVTTPISPLPKAPSGANWNAASPEATWAHSQAQSELPSWQEQLAPAMQAEQPWYENDQYAATSAPSMQNWENLPNASQTQHGWESETQEEEQPAQPDWLNTLTRSEQPQAVEPVYQAPSALVPTYAETPVIAQPQAAQEDEAMPFFLPAENAENEGEMGWPAWLKSLGAESLEPDAAPEQSAQIEPTPVQPAWNDTYTSQPMHEADRWAAQPAMSASHTSQPEAPSQPDWMQQLTPPVSEAVQPATPDWMQQFSPPVSEPVQSTTPDWMQQFASAESLSYPQPATPAPIAEQEQHYITSLEDLEKSLQAQGFAPLTPGTLASLAQAQANAPLPTQPQEQPSLSSALAQLGNFAQPPVAPATSTGEPWWNTMLSQTPEQTAPTGSPMPNEQVNPFTALGAHSTQETNTPMPALPATPAPLAATPFQQNASQITAPLTPVYRSDALLDSDLETTMKRPAVKLQPMQVGQSGDRPYTNGKSHNNERLVIEHRDDSHMNNHERLVRGYQYQLSGAYDEAMNDYRLIIRNAPELLDDVISNMRALLKLNPRFSLGYRVLGDAYMRKGEYLQAMESYNKALTMAKKARS